MDFEDIGRRGLVLLGCGRMGGAMLSGWIAGGLPAGSVTVLDPNPPRQVADLGVRLNAELPSDPAAAVVAVKPQMMEHALPSLKPLGGGRTLVLSVAAGVPLQRFESELGAGTPVVRIMPNTPAAIGRGISALVANGAAGEAGVAVAERLMAAVGETVRLDDERQMDAVTAVSGSGPAYVFHLIETMAAAGEAQGLPADMALRLARATVAGAGALAVESGEEPAELRRAVTSPGGTTAAALEVLMDDSSGFGPLLRRAVAAAARRSRELGQ
ncbi:pyrroline-5-carboxylate reductase [Roseitranquillus sediminis]|uniref:pyrroline-5-carboxylate reductase n=1 Tax=Roseitranquillus sediminis TaxID=2809051 RepID=UPI001D0C1D63|nr:pyrroline-5-carboxylate reductase [Roseitranquillus sediminis]MBM9594449.1 pyrroline-5-carboxylate reductase [Roseitranquillus sediminis]